MATVALATGLQLKSVLIATDFSEASEKPLHHALAIAQRYQSKFCLAHVVSSLALTMVGPDAITATEEAVRRDAARLESEIAATGALDGVPHQVIIRHGEVWPQLEEIIRQEQVDLVVVGTHGRRGIGKLLLGSVAEQIFRHADCLVLTVGPSSYHEARVDEFGADRTFLFATDLGPASLEALPYAISSANQFSAKLVLMHVLPPVPIPAGFHWYGASDLIQMRDNARMASLRRLREVIRDAPLKVRPESVVEFGSANSVSDSILGVAERLKADLIIMGLRRSAHIGIASHMPWATAYRVACSAGCPVLTVRSHAQSG